MTIPFPIDPPKDAEGLTLREALFVTRTSDPGDPDPGPSGASAIPDVALPILDGGEVTVMTAQPSAAEDYGWARPWFDSRAFNQMRIIADVETAGHTTAEVFAEQATTSGGTFMEPGVSAAPVAVPIAAVGQAKSAWIPLGTAAIGDRVWGARARGGNTSATPVVKKVHLQFRQATVPRPPRGTPPDLPEGAPWGDILFDANAAHPSMAALYGDGDDVNNFLEQIAGRDLTTGATLLLPKYRASGFNGSRPCVEWDGSNVLLNCADASVLQGGAWTKYLVVENLDGGDGASLWVSGSGSFSWGLAFDDGNLYAQSNNLFGSYTQIPDDWGLLGAHIYRFVKSSSSAHWRVFVDGVMKENIGNAPQSSDGTTAQLMDLVSGLGLSGRIARIVEYNTPHDSPTGPGTPADGLTAPEVALQSFWGTP